MVRWAESRIREGHLPFDGWYPYLSLGASRFHHYQSLPHIVTAYLSVLLGTDRVYQWTLYLLLSLWPIAVYAGMRLFGWGPWPSALGALVSPLLASKPGLGYEDGSYAWRGYGTWSQLWGMWLLPLAWGLSWRAVAKKGSYALAALAVGLTICVHLLTGYLAVLSIGVWVLLKPPEIVRRAGRAAIVAIGALCVASFMLVPLLLDVSVMPQSEISRGTIYYDSFGAKKILAWMFTGQIFDRGRLLPAISILVLVGFIVCLVRFRRDERARAVLAVGLFSLVLFFGRPTLGPVLKIFPGSSDLFLRRFIMGVHLAGIYLAGVGLAAIGRTVRSWLDRHEIGWRPSIVTAVFAILVAVVLFPAWSERAAWAEQGRVWIHEQLAADATDGADLVALIDEAEQMGSGRIFAGLRGSGGGCTASGRSRCTRTCSTTMPTPSGSRGPPGRSRARSRCSSNGRTRRTTGCSRSTTSSCRPANSRRSTRRWWTSAGTTRCGSSATGATRASSTRPRRSSRIGRTSERRCRRSCTRAPSRRGGSRPSRSLGARRAPDAHGGRSPARSSGPRPHRVR